MFFPKKKYKAIKSVHLIFFVFFIGSAKAQDNYYFPSSLISLDNEKIADLSTFETKGFQLPGNYDVDVYLNGKLKFRKNINFVKTLNEQNENTLSSIKHKDSTGLTPIFTREDFIELGVNPDRIPVVKDNKPINISELIPDSYTDFNFPKMELNISIPQVALVNTAKDEVPTSLWDNGINALFTSYNLGLTDNQYKSDFNKNLYLNLRSGINLGSWRYRDNRTWTKNKSKHKKDNNWQYLNSYIERDVIPWHSRLVFGDSSTNNPIFDSLYFRGMQLKTDESMYPASLQGFSPIIKGVANSNATVEISQNGYLIYQTTVPPGEFAITDLNAINSSGDLQVRILEATGYTQSFTVPYASVPILLRDGRYNYSITAGQYRSDNNNYDSPIFTEGTLVWGVSSSATLYGGIQYSNHYLSGVIGSGLNLGKLGAVSVDVTHAKSELADGSLHQGQSLRFLYARAFPDIGTNLQLTGYRYSTQGYYTLKETALNKMSGWGSQNEIVNSNGEIVKNNTDYFDLSYNKRERLQANISQKIDGVGSIYLSGVHQSFWGRTSSSLSLQAGISSQIADVNYTLSYNLNQSFDKDENRIKDRNLFLTISIPLQKLLPQDSPTIYASYSANHDNEGNLIQQTSLSGNLLTQHNINWNVAQGYSSNTGYDGNLNLAYQGGYGNVQTGYSYGENYRKISTGLSGGITLYSGGIILSQPLGETNVLISAPGASDIPVENTSGVSTDIFGYTIKPYATPYRLNRIALDVSDLDERTEIENNVITTVPTRGAIVKANFITRHGVRALVRIVKDGKNLPFGSIVSVNNQTAIVGDDGLVYLSGLEKMGYLEAKWGHDEEEKCNASYTLPPDTEDSLLARFQVNCQ